MKILRMHALACLAAFTLALPATAQDAVKFSDIAGWWSADPEFGGESSHLAMQFLEKDGKQEAHVWLMAIGAYDINLGAVAINGNSVDSQGLSFPLTWNPEKRTLSGVIPAEAAPIYNIPVEFRRSGPAEKPAPREWKAPRPQVLWTAETGAAVWAGIERADDGTLFVGNENGDLNAIGRDGKPRWKFSTGKPIRAQPKVIGKFVYLHSDSGYLHQLDRKTGAETWRADVDDGSEPRIPTDNEKTRWDRYGSSVVTDGRRLFVASRDKNLYAIDMRTGRESWRVAAADIMTATPALHGDLVIFAALDGKVQAVSAKDGQPRWSRAIFKDFGAQPGYFGAGSSPIVEGDKLLVNAGGRGAGIVALSLGGEHRTEMAIRAGDWLVRKPFNRYQETVGIGDRYFYGAFYCSQAMFQLGGRYWERFFPGLLDTLVRNQLPDGSWEKETYGDPMFGRTYTTALAVLAITPPYQMLPIFQR